MEVDSMTSLQRLEVAAQPTTAIARMFGKAVKVRHCPATVSAPALLAVVFVTGTKEVLARVLRISESCPFSHWS
jgi:hypothetical protein